MGQHDSFGIVGETHSWLAILCLKLIGESQISNFMPVLQVKKKKQVYNILLVDNGSVWRIPQETSSGTFSSYKCDKMH